MEKRDLLRDEIERLGKILAKIMADFFGLKSSVDPSLKIQQANEQLKEELDLDINQLLKLSYEQLRAYLKERKLTAEHVELLGDYFSEIAKSDLPDAERYANTAIELYNVANETANTISLERLEKMSALKKHLN